MISRDANGPSPLSPITAAPAQQSNEAILLIEDDATLGQQIVDHLRGLGFSCVWWKFGRSIDPADFRNISLIVLDLMLPGTPGLDLLRQIRQESDVPVLIVSARQDSHDKVRAFQLGADDYITKPFWPEEFIERVYARLRRPAMEHSSQLRSGGLLLDRANREAWHHGTLLTLTRAEFDLLFALAQRAGEPVTRRWLLNNALDPEREATERTLDVHISRLRKKLHHASLIETVWGIGYRLRKEPFETPAT